MARALSNPVYLTSPEKGVDGRTTIAKARAPLMTDGRIGDFFIDTVGQKLYGPKNAAEWPDNGLIKGDGGWSPVFAAVTDGTRRVQRVTDWQGGEGTKPATGKYVGATGLVDNIADAIDIRGPQGPTMVIDDLDVAPAGLTDATLVPTAEAGDDNVKRTVVEVFDLGALLERRSLAHAQASDVGPEIKRVRTQFYAPSYADLATLVGGATYKRVNSEPSHAGKFRSVDRYTAEGDTDSTHGGWWELAEAIWRPAMFGAIGGDVSKDTAAFTAMLSVGGHEIDGDGLMYKLNQKLEVRSNTTIRNAVLDMTAVSMGTTYREVAIAATGTISGPYSLTADAVGSFAPAPFVRMDAGDAVNFVPGELIYIRSNEIWNPSSGSQVYVGEMAQVKAVSGTDVFLYSPLSYSYTVANSAVAYRITPVENITLDNVAAFGPSTLSAMTPKLGFFGAQHCLNVRVTGCRIRDFNRAAVEFRASHKCWMESCDVRNIFDYYGCFIASGSSYVTVAKNVFDETRHGVSVGSTNSFYGGINTYLTIDGNRSTGRDAALDCHEPADFVRFTDNDCRCEGAFSSPNGIIYQGRNGIISGNAITGHVRNGIFVQPLHNYPAGGDIVISGNVIDTDLADSSSAGIYVNNGAIALTTPPALTAISGNTVKGAFVSGIHVKNDEAAPKTIENVAITGNAVKGSVTAIQLRTDTSHIRGVTLTGNILDGGTTAVSLRADDVGDVIGEVAIAGNVIKNFTTGITKSGSGTVTAVGVGKNPMASVTTQITPALMANIIAAGAITLSGSFDGYTIDTEASAASDDLDTINGGAQNQIAVFRAVNSARTIVFKDGTGNLRLAGDFSADNAEDVITMICDGTVWRELSRSDNGA